MLLCTFSLNSFNLEYYRNITETLSFCFAWHFVAMHLKIKLKDLQQPKNFIGNFNTFILIEPENTENTKA